MKLGAAEAWGLSLWPATGLVRAQPLWPVTGPPKPGRCVFTVAAALVPLWPNLGGPCFRPSLAHVGLGALRGVDSRGVGVGLRVVVGVRVRVRVRIRVGARVRVRLRVRLRLRLRLGLGLRLS